MSKLEKFIDTYGTSGISRVLRSVADVWYTDQLSPAQISLIIEVANSLESALIEFDKTREKPKT